MVASAARSDASKPGDLPSPAVAAPTIAVLPRGNESVIAIGSRRLEDDHRLAVLGNDLHAHRHADPDFVGRDALDPAHHPRSLGQIDQRHVIAGLRRLPADDGGRIDRPQPGRLDPLQVARAGAGGDRAGIEDILPAGAAALDHEAALGQESLEIRVGVDVCHASGQFPVKSGGRFSMKARAPSLKSSVCTSSGWKVASRSSAWSKVWPAAAANWRLAAESAMVGPLAKPRASSIALGSTSAAGKA